MKASEFKNPDGTFNGLAFMAEFSGLSEAEIKWMWNRMKEIRSEGTPTNQITDILRKEAINRPWEEKP